MSAASTVTRNPVNTASQARVGSTYSHKAKHLAYLLAAHANEPICSTLENFWANKTVQFLDTGNAPSNKELSEALSKVSLKFPIQLIFSLMIASVGVALRWIASSLEKEPFTYFAGEAEEKFAQRNTSIKSVDFNICGVRGFTLTDGGVAPIHNKFKGTDQTRIQAIIAKLKEENADVISLYECFDYKTAMELYEGLKGDYAHFYFNMGNKNPFAPNSTIFVASKFPVKNPKFEYLKDETLTERAKKSGKGIFTFDLCDKEGNPVFTKISTHLQHSEIPGKPTGDEIAKRKKQVERITEIAEEAAKNNPVILGGDLNLDREEWNQQPASKNWDCNPSLEAGTYSWKGDKFSTDLMQAYFELPWWKKIFCPPSFLYYHRDMASNAQQLDHIASYQSQSLPNGLRSLSISMKEVGFDPNRYQSDALSDHAMMVGRFVVANREG